MAVFWASNPLVASAQTNAQSVNAGQIPANRTLPFSVNAVATFNYPWAIAFLPDGKLLVTEKPGKLYEVTQQGAKAEIAGIPAVSYSGQNGLLDVAISPRFAQDKLVYLTYVEPGTGGGNLAMGRGELGASNGKPQLANFSVIWRSAYKGSGGQPGGIMAFSPDGQSLFLTAGDRMRPETAQDPDVAAGKVFRLKPDGSVPNDNPLFAQGGVKAQTWTIGHRNPYGLAFAPDGKLWLHEMGPKGGDELNHIEPGKNYGWPLVSNGDNYNGVPIPRHATRPEFQAPAVYWTPIVAPAGLVFYSGDMFAQWKGSALIGGLASNALMRITFGANNTAQQSDKWDLGRRIRDVAVASDGAVWLIEDASDGRLLRLTSAK